jgi:hypothetical protein
MRIDSGWRVNAYGPIGDLSRIELLNGSLHLMASVPDDAKNQLQNNISFAQTDTAGATKVFQNKGFSATGSEDPASTRAGRDGNVRLNGTYPVNASLTVDGGQAIVFNVTAGSHEISDPNFPGGPKNLPMFSRTNGAVYIHDTTNGPCFTMKTGSKIAVRLTNGSTFSGKIDENSQENFFLVRAPFVASIADIIDLPDLAPSENFLELPNNGNTHLYEIEGDLVDTDYDDLNASSLQQLKLFWMTDESKEMSGLVFGTGKLWAMKESPGSLANQPLVDGSMPRMIDDMLVALHGAIESRLCDVKGNSDDPFIGGFGVHVRRDFNTKSEYESNGYGMYAGIDGIKETERGTMMRYGAFAGFGRNRIAIMRSDKTSEDSADMTMACGAVFMALETFNEGYLKSDINGMVGVARINNHTRRLNPNEQQYFAKYSSTSIFADGELIKNMYRWRGAQIGPWIAVSYHLVRGDAHRESGPDANSAILFPSTTAEFLRTSLGINLEREFFSTYNPTRHTKLFAKAGWTCEPVRPNRPIKAFVGNDEFSPLISSGSRHAFTVSGGFRSRLDDHFEITGSFLGRLSGDSKFISASASLGYSF